MHSLLRSASLLVVGFWLHSAVSAEQQVGQASFTRGAVTSHSTSGDVQILDRGAPLFAGDVIRTGDNSVTVLKFNDATRSVLRPQSVFKIEEYSEVAGEETAFMRLFKGGIRAISGALSKRNPNAFKLRTSVATIGIRGTEYDVRLCAEDCRSEAENFGWASKIERRLISGRAALLRGDVTARNKKGVSRKLNRRDPVYEGDVIETAAKSFVILVLSDRSRITLPSSSSIQIEEMRYDAQYPKENSSVLRLIRGGMRQLTGLIARSRPSAVRVRTAAATIGIRGTGFDLYCDENCADVGAGDMPTAQAKPLEKILGLVLGNAHAAAQKGLIVNVWKGAVDMSSTCGSEAINQGEAVQFQLEGCQVERLSESPLDFDAPRPDEPEIDFEGLFDGASDDGDPGLYLACFDGQCTLTNDHGTVELTGGEAAYAAGPDASPEKLDFIPPFQSQDPWLEAIDENKQGRFNLLDDDVGGSGFQCSVF